MAINFPDSPNNGDSFTSNNKTWVFDGTVWNITSGTNSVADGAITTAKIASNAVHQTKLASNLSAITVTTTANRGTAVPSPFTGQTIFLTDVKRMQVWDGSVWMFMTVGVPDAPTSLSATPLSTTSVSVAFTAGSQNGSIISNYKYALSTNGGSTYSEYAALDPADAVSPITISGLTGATTYHIKLKAVADFGDSVDSSAVSVTTLTPPGAPTSLSATALSGTSVSIAFTAGATGGSAFTNMEYALSTNSGATYGAYTAFSPPDYITPVVISGLTNNTQYTIKLRHVTTAGVGPDSSAVTITTPIDVEYLLVAGGGGGGFQVGGGGGAGGLIYNSYIASPSTNYAASIGSGGSGGTGSARANNGVNTTLNTGATTLTCLGGGGGANHNATYNQTSPAGGWNGGSGGGGSGDDAVQSRPGGSGQQPGSASGGFGNNGGTGFATSWAGGGGGGAGAVGANATANTGGAGGIGRAYSISGASTYYAGGGGGCNNSNSPAGAGGLGGGGQGQGNGNNVPAKNGTANTGGGGGGVRDTSGDGGNGGSGIIILSYLSSFTITLGAGLTGSTTTVGGNKVTTITAGSGNVSWA